jgi:hypothetical protein
MGVERAQKLLSEEKGKARTVADDPAEATA